MADDGVHSTGGHTSGHGRRSRKDGDERQNPDGKHEGRQKSRPGRGGQATQGKGLGGETAARQQLDAEAEARRKKEREEEDEKRRKAEEEERARQEFEAALQAQKDAVVQAREILQAEEARRQMRESNSPESVARSREKHEQDRSLKSDLKRITALTKKVRVITSDSVEAVLNDIKALNLHHFVSEFVTAILESRLKTSGDVVAAVRVCSALHQRYADFSSGLMEGLANLLLPPLPSGPSTTTSSTAAGGGIATDEDKETARRKRQGLRLLLELFLAGFHRDVPLVAKVFRSIVPPPVSGGGEGGPMDSAQQQGGGGAVAARQQQLRFRRQAVTLDVNLFVTYVKYGGEAVLRVLPRKYRVIFEKANREGVDCTGPLGLVEEQLSTQLRERAEAAYEGLCGQLLSMHKEKQAAERRAERDRLMHGSLTEEKEKALEEQRKNYEKLLANLQALSDGLDIDLPELPEDVRDEDEVGGVLGLTVWDGELGQTASSFGPYDDEETRSFYEDLPDLLAMLPPTLLGLTEEEAEKLRKENEAKRQQQAQQEEEKQADAEVEAMTVDLSALSMVEGAEATEHPDEASGAGDSMDAAEEEDDAPRTLKAEVSEAEAALPAHRQVAQLIDEALPACYNRDRADDFCQRFCHLSSKSSRKRLVAALYDVPRHAIDLLPQYARIVATLDRVMKDIAPALLEELKAEFRYFQRKKPTSHLEPKIRNVKYIAEFVKFKIAPPIVPFTILKVCLEHFTPHNVEVTCALLESCGRWLFRTGHTHAKLVHYLDVMMRLKKVRNFDPTTEALIDNAFYVCNPPERSERKVIAYTALEQYVRHLVFEDLTEATVEAVIIQLRKLPWADQAKAMPAFFTDSVILACQGRYDDIHLICDTLAGLNKYQHATIIKLADRVLEELNRALETTVGREPQGYLAMSKLLGEMYNYAIIKSSVVFDALELFINHGHEVPEHLKQPTANPEGRHLPPLPPLFPPYVTHDPRIPTPFDPPADTFRTQLVIRLLQTTGPYFVAGKTKHRLDRFLTYFQRYLFLRGYVPLSTEMDVLDLLEELEGHVRDYQQKVTDRRSHAREEASSDPLIPRFNSFEEVQAVIDKMESETYRNLLAREAASKGSDQGEDDDDDDGDDFGDEDEGMDDVHRGGGGRGSRRENDEGMVEGDEGGLTEDEERTDDDDDDDDDEEEEVAVRRAQQLKTEEDLEFEKEFEMAFAATVMNAVEERKSTARQGIAADNMVLPSTLRKALPRARVHHEEERDENRDGSLDMGVSLTGTLGVKFKVLRRANKGKIDVKELVVPDSSALAAQIKIHQDAEREEHNVLKQKVLQYQQEMEEGLIEEEPVVPLSKVHNAPLPVDQDGAPLPPPHQHQQGPRGGSRGGGQQQQYGFVRGGRTYLQRGGGGRGR